ncbi:MAG: hypothetical protein ACR2QL_13035 [Woeseiaceae bacterium]
MTSPKFRSIAASLALASVLLGACSSTPQVKTTVELAEAADAPYEKILVIFLAESFDSRRYLEMEIVKKLGQLGTEAVRSTTMMDTKTPVTRQTFLDMVAEVGADAVLVSQIADLRAKGEVVDMNPQATYNFRPTYYYNVWSVELTEYRDPEAINFEYELWLATQLYSVDSKDVVWAIEADTKFDQKFDGGPDYQIYIDEAAAIVNSLNRDGLIKK